MDPHSQLIATFHAVVEEGTIVGAARRLGRTQPAITARIQQLEESLGVPLFSRVGRRLVLTPTGRLAAARAKEVVAATAAFRDEILGTAADPTGLLRVGALPTVSSFRLAPRLPGLMHTYSTVQIELFLSTVDAMFADLRARRLDAVVSVGEPKAADLDHKVIDHVKPVAVFRRGEAPASKSVTHTDLQPRSYIAFPSESVDDPFFDAVGGFTARYGLHERCQLRVAHIQSIKGLVAAGGSYAILPAYVVVEAELETRPIRRFSPSFPMVLSTAPGTSGNTQRLLRLLEDAIG